jgi:hypothetical protein
MTVRSLSRGEANSLLASLGFQIGQWNEIADTKGTPLIYSIDPGKCAEAIFSTCEELAAWLGIGKWTLLQVDNSTAPLGIQARVLEDLLFASKRRWDVAAEKSFLIEGPRRDALLIVLMHFCLMFEWHVTFVSDLSSGGQRLSLQDGIIHLLGDQDVVEAGRAIGSIGG